MGVYEGNIYKQAIKASKQSKQSLDDIHKGWGLQLKERPNGLRAVSPGIRLLLVPMQFVLKEKGWDLHSNRGPLKLFLYKGVGLIPTWRPKKFSNGYLQRNVQWYGTYTLRDAQKSLRAVSPRIMLLLVLVWKKVFNV